MLCRSGMILMYAICKRQRWPCMPKEAHLSLTLQCCAYRQIKTISLDCYYLLYQLSLKVLEQIIWMAWQPFCCKIIATHLAAINSKQRSALAGWRWADCHLKCPPHGCGCTREKGLLVGMQTYIRSTCLFRKRGWQHLARSQWSHQCQMVGKYRQVQPSAGWGALWWIPNMSNLGTTTLS